MKLEPKNSLNAVNEAAKPAGFHVVPNYNHAGRKTGYVIWNGTEYPEFAQNLGEYVRKINPQLKRRG